MAKVEALIADAVGRGARIVTGGVRLDRPGTFLAPTVLTDIAVGSDLLRQEIFGPVLAVVPFDTEDEAIGIANDTDFGLISYVYPRPDPRSTHDRATADRHDGPQRRRCLQCRRAVWRLENVGTGP